MIFQTGRSDLLMCPPQSSPLPHFPNPLNNNTSSLNHNLGLLKGGLLSANNNGHGGYSQHPGLKSEHSDKFISQRRSHHQSQGYQQQQHQLQHPFPDGGAAVKTERKSPNYSSSDGEWINFCDQKYSSAYVLFILYLFVKSCETSNGKISL